MVLGIRSKSKKSVSIQVHYIIHVQEIKPWPPSQSLRSVQTVLLQWENGDQNSGSLPSTAGNGKIEFNESFRLSVLMCREASKKGKHRETFQKNCLEFYLYDKTVKSQLLGSATINLADFGIIKETKALSIQFNCKKSSRISSQPFLYVNIQPFDIESSSSSPSSSLSKELSLEKEGSESVSQSLKDDDNLEIASFTDDDSDDIPSNTSQTSRPASEITGDSTKISRGTEGSHGEFVLPSESTTASLLGNAEGEPSTQSSGIISPSSSEIRKSIQQYSPSYMSSSSKPNFERSLRSQVTQEDSMTQEDGTRDRRFNKDSLEKVSGVSKTGVMDDKEKTKEGRKGQEQFTMRNELLENELVNNLSDDDSTKKGKFNSTTHLLNKKLHDHPTSILMNDKTEDVTNVKSPPQSAENYGLFISSQTHNQAEEINTMNDVHVGTACHEDVNVNGSFHNNETELKAEVEMLREELREAAALEVSMYSVIAEHGSSSNKVHAPARRLSRFYFHACRVGSPATMATAAQSAVSGFVLVSKACGNDVPRLTFWFSNLILLRAIVSKEVENIHFGDGPSINSESDGTGNTLHKEEKDNTEKHFHRWEDPETFLVALEKVEAWIFSRIVESVWWQTLTPYMQSAAAKNSSSRKAYERRYRVGDQDQGSFSIDLWKRAFKDACERICPLRAGGHECGCLLVIARLVMEQLVSRLDVAMFNAILRESAEEMPMDPISDPISDSMVLPIPAGKSGFGAGAQLKNAIGDWSRWLSDLFSIDDSDSREVSNENNESKCESSFKPFQFLNALSDLMMLPLDLLADGSMIKELQEVGNKTSLRTGSFVLKKLYTSDDELDELDSPLSALGMDDSSLSSKEKLALVKGGRKVVRYELLREAWKTSE
uniref:C2 NT-type domain-containing protein n=1 Tax=Glycine max TaxID=3847 RepID=A0A368UGA6_SOYBN